MMNTNPLTSAAHFADQRLNIELLALDLSTCGRCTGTETNLDAAFATVADVLGEAEVEVNIRKTVITSAEQAVQLRFESSPTIRVNGRDIALELRESNCGDCGELAGCGSDSVDCRVWVWRGREYTEAPKAMIVDAILRAYGQANGPTANSRKPFRLPQNLQRFFQARATKVAGANSATECCDRTTCCDESEKQECCGTTAAAATGACGCKGS